jgi:hypothetical protein
LLSAPLKLYTLRPHPAAISGHIKAPLDVSHPPHF